MKLRSQGFRLCGHSLNILQHRLYRNLLDLAFREEDRAGRIFFDEGRVVRGHDYGATLTSDFLEQPNDAFGRQRIEVAGRFVGQKRGGDGSAARAMTRRCCSPPESSNGIL